MWGPSWPWSYGSWIYNYLCLSPLMLWARISIRTRCTILCDTICRWLAATRWFSPDPQVSSTNKTDRHDITEILVKVALSTTKQTNKHMFMCMLIYHSQWHHYEYIIYPLYIFTPMLFIYFFLLYFSKYVIWLNDNNLIW